jgi:hypothetical protein
MGRILGPLPSEPDEARPVSTRVLILLALACGVAILVAFALQLFIAR